MRRTIASAVVAVVALAACGDTAEAGDPGDGSLQRAPAYVKDVEFVMLESYPVQVRANVTGDLPTPCHQLAWEVGEPGADGRIDLEVYSTIDPEAVCVEVLEPFETEIGIGSFETGDYVLVVDGVEYPFTI